MKYTVRVTKIFIIIIFFLTIGFAMSMLLPSHKRTLIVTYGNGGDYTGAKTLYEELSAEKIDVTLYNLSENKYDINLSKISTLAVIGQGAINEIMSNKINLNSNKLLFYSHLYSPEMVDFINEIATKQSKKNKIIVYITSSQLKSLEQMQKFFIENVHIIPTKLVINTYSENSKLAELTEADMLTLEQVLANQTIHLGGSYKNIQNEWVYVNGEQIVSAIKNLPLMEGDQQFQI